VSFETHPAVSVTLGVAVHPDLVAQNNLHDARGDSYELLFITLIVSDLRHWIRVARD
jgi:hypothetical protein